MADKELDILIVGGGLTGATLLLALANMGLTTTLVEARPFSERARPDFDARTLALAPASIKILNMLNAWPLLKEEATVIDTIHVSERRQFGHTTLRGETAKPLGYVVEMQHINNVLHQLLPHEQIMAPAQLTALNPNNGLATILTEDGEVTIKARLIVAADGADSYVRQLCNISAKIKEYERVAFVANIGLARHHQNCAYERFTASGPLALLPMSGLRSSMIWSVGLSNADQLMNMSDVQFLSALQREFGYRLGRFVKVGQRARYPLRQVVTPKPIAWPVVFVGNAAHTLHPVAGQGFNLGLRDVALLAQCIGQEGLNENMLNQYQTLRRFDQVAITRFTDGLINLFTSQLPGWGIARGVGLAAFDNMSLIKKTLARYARGYAGVYPDLVCGIPLSGKVSQ